MIPDEGLVFVRDDCLGGPLTALYMIGQARELPAAWAKTGITAAPGTF
jgi:hypothetical protein